MKRFAKVLALVIALAALLAVSAAAADFTHCADALKDMGLFQGTDQGYDLDRAPTRAEAAAMLVRLLGKDAEAKAVESYTAPFTDVADWAKPYVQYLYDNGLTKGKTATTFGSTDKCIPRQYATFLLRALGYTEADEGGDFTFGGAKEFAEEIGLIDAVNCDPNDFLRDDAVAMSYTALSLPPKSGEADLLTKLSKEGAVPNAQKYLDLFAAHRAYSAAAKDSGEETSMSAVMDINMDVQLANVDYFSGKIAMDFAAHVDPAKLDEMQMAYNMKMDMAFTDTAAKTLGLSAEDAKLQADAKCFFTGGALYMDMMDQKIKMPMDLAAVLGQVSPGAFAGTGSSAEPISAILSLTKSGDSYAVTYAPAVLGGVLERVMESVPTPAGTPGFSLGFDSFRSEITIRNGQPQAMKGAMAMHAAVEGMTVSFTMDLDMHDMKTGSAVKVDIPADLSGYTEMSSVGVIGGADGPTGVIVTAPGTAA